MILHAQFFKRSKSIQIILAPRETSRTRVAKTWIEGTKEGGSNFVRETRVLWAFSFKYYIHSKKKKEKKRKKSLDPLFTLATRARPPRGTGVGLE